MENRSQMGRLGILMVLGIGTCEVLIMISPFAGFFYSGMRFEPILGVLSASPVTAWMDGFFLNHSVTTTSRILEWQRAIGTYVFALGMWGFLVSAGQVYTNKILKRGVATGLLYRVSRHPQYLSLGVAGWGLLTIWPRFLLLGLWVTMLFLYGWLARFEEKRMEERFGEAYRGFASGRGVFLPGSPARRLFEASFGRLQPRALGYLAAYAFCLALAFSFGGALRSLTRVSTVIVQVPEQQAMVISAWPKSEDWVERVFAVAAANDQVQERLDERGERPVVATILPPQYVMRSMFYTMPASGAETNSQGGIIGIVRWFGRTATAFLLPVQGITRSSTFMGVDPDDSDDPVEVVFSRAEKPYKETLGFDEALDASVRLIPLVVVEVQPAMMAITEIRVPLPQNRWGPHVVMPLF